MRAAAPTWRIGMMKWRVEREPSVSWLPYLTSSPVACATFTLAQSASSSSATISGMPVRTPWPISERWQTMVTVPSGAIETKASGLLTVPCGMPSAPHFGAAARAARGGRTVSGEDEPAGRNDALEDAAPADILDAGGREFANVLGHVRLPQLA